MNGIGFILLLFLHLLLGFVVFVASVVVTDADDDDDLPKLLGAALIWEIVLPILGMYCICAFTKSVIEQIAFGEKEE